MELLDTCCNKREVYRNQWNWVEASAPTKIPTESNSILQSTLLALRTAARLLIETYWIFHILMLNNSTLSENKDAPKSSFTRKRKYSHCAQSSVVLILHTSVKLVECQFSFLPGSWCPSANKKSAMEVFQASTTLYLWIMVPTQRLHVKVIFIFRT
jgi:hypothetical protein